MASPNDLISIKLQLGADNRRVKLPLRELAPSVLPQKLKQFLSIPETKNVTFERYSDSAGNYVVLDPHNQAVYKQLYRAAKAKSKLRIKVTIAGPNESISSPIQEHINGSEVTLAPTVMSTRPNPEASKASMTPHYTEPLVQLDDKLSANGAIKSQPVDMASDEAPLPRPFALRDQFYEDLANAAKLRNTALRANDQTFQVPLTSFTVQCNYCGTNIPNAHWHCNVCDHGDFDLCLTCVESGMHCDVDNHYLIKRTIEDGKVKYSTSTIVDRKVPKPEVKAEEKKEMPGAFKGDVKEEVSPEPAIMTRTCNCCVNEYEESNFVTCLDCEDYDLCMPCHYDLKHGHHPSHSFTPVSQDINMDSTGTLLCAPGRNLRHLAICDGCDKDIHGIRHKCMNCPDWDYCTTCVKSARHIHPGHRFVPIYEHIAGPVGRLVTHHHIRCDGPLCKDKTNYIRGDRYKCAVCNDTDFCANCEALPTNPHNRTHPLIKFRTPVRNVSVTTFGEKENGEVMKTMGDSMPQTSSKSTETMPAQSANAATQVQTVAETKPAIKIEPSSPKAQAKEIKQGQNDVEHANNSVPALVAGNAGKIERTPSPALPTFDAHFVRDTIVDGSKLPADRLVHQVWVLRNPGPLVWPAGCSVNYIGGDNMLNVDSKHPASTSDLDKATQSNVIPRPVAVDEEVCFSVTLKTPERLGKSISYWRLKTADGIPFGHKLWCDIDVVESPVTESAKEVSESQMIFPKLEKESPVSSTVVTEAAESSPSITPRERDLEEDLESLSLEDDETDGGFLTDEEYDMLDPEATEEAINGKN